MGCHRPKLPARFCDSVFSGPEEDGTAHQLSLGGLKSADLEGGFKIFQTIFSAPEKSEYTYIYNYRHIHGRYPPNKNLDLFIGVPNNCEYLIGGLSFGYFPSLREWLLGGLLCAGSESIVSIGRVYMFELYIYM